jgi:hypothetical protein
VRIGEIGRYSIRLIFDVLVSICGVVKKPNFNYQCVT